MMKAIKFPSEISDIYAITDGGDIINVKTKKFIKKKPNVSGYDYVYLARKGQGARKRYNVFKLYALNYFCDENLKIYNYNNILVKAKDKNQRNFSKDNVEIKLSSRVVQSKDELEVDKFITFPVNVYKNRYAFNSNYELIDVIKKEKVATNETNGKRVFYKLLSNNGKTITAYKNRLLYFNYVLEDKLKRLNDKYFLITPKNGDVHDSRLDNLECTITSTGKEAMKLWEI